MITGSEAGSCRLLVEASVGVIKRVSCIIFVGLFLQVEFLSFLKYVRRFGAIAEIGCLRKVFCGVNRRWPEEKSNKAGLS